MVAERDSPRIMSFEVGELEDLEVGGIPPPVEGRLWPQRDAFIIIIIIIIIVISIIIIIISPSKSSSSVHPRPSVAILASNSMGKAEKAEYQRRVRRCTRSLALCSPRLRHLPQKGPGGLDILARRLLRALDTDRITAIRTAESDKESLSFLPPILAETMWEQIVAKGTIDVLWIKEQLDLLARAESGHLQVGGHRLGER